MLEPHRALGLATAPSGNVTVADIARLRPVEPVTLLRPHAARRAARFFVERFPGKSLYAVKANPSPDLLRILWDSGVTHYDVASLGEVRLVAQTLPQATSTCWSGCAFRRIIRSSALPPSSAPSPMK